MYDMYEDRDGNIIYDCSCEGCIWQDIDIDEHLLIHKYFPCDICSRDDDRPCGGLPISEE